MQQFPCPVCAGAEKCQASQVTPAVHSWLPWQEPLSHASREVSPGPWLLSQERQKGKAHLLHQGLTYADEPSSLPYSQPFCASGISTVMTSPGSKRSRVRLAPVVWGAIACTLTVPPLRLPSLLLLASPKEPERETRPAGTKPAERH